MTELTDVARRNRVSDISRRLFESASADAVPSNRQSQLAVVGRDLCMSVCEAAALRNETIFFDDELVADFIDEHSRRVNDVLSAIPSAFHHWSLKNREGREVEVFDMKVAEMEDACQNLTEIEPQDIVVAYGTVWRHTRVLDEIRQNTKSEAMRNLCLHPSNGGIEYVAGLYLANDDFASPLLEWAIVDSLVFCRIAEYGAVCAFTGNLPDTSDGQITEGPLLPVRRLLAKSLNRPDTLAGFGIALVDPGTKLLSELLVLGLSWWVCGLLAGTDGLARWILFTGLTAGRWVTQAVMANDTATSAKKGETNLQMLWDMSLAHERIPSMNVGLLRHLFYRLEERGGAFSPSVYAILDKRQRRKVAE